MNISKRNTDLPQADAPAASLVDEIASIGKLQLSSGNRLMELQNELMDIAVAEQAQRRDELLAIKRSTPALLQWPTYGQARAERSVEMARAWWEVAARTQGAMLEAIRECLPRGSASSAQRSRPGLAFTERRYRSTVISFPERRRIA